MPPWRGNGLRDSKEFDSTTPELARIVSKRTARLQLCESFCILSETMSKAIPLAVFGVVTALSETLPVQSVTFIERKCQKVLFVTQKPASTNFGTSNTILHAKSHMHNAEMSHVLMSRFQRGENPLYWRV